MADRAYLHQYDEMLVSVDRPAYVEVTMEPEGKMSKRVRNKIKRLERENQVLLARMQYLEEQLEMPKEMRRWKGLPTLNG